MLIGADRDTRILQLDDQCRFAVLGMGGRQRGGDEGLRDRAEARVDGEAAFGHHIFRLEDPHRAFEHGAGIGWELRVGIGPDHFHLRHRGQAVLETLERCDRALRTPLGDDLLQEGGILAAALETGACFGGRIRTKAQPFEHVAVAREFLEQFVHFAPVRSCRQRHGIRLAAAIHAEREFQPTVVLICTLKMRPDAVTAPLLLAHNDQSDGKRGRNAQQK